MDIIKLQSKISAGKYIISFTHTEKVRARMIEVTDLEEAMLNGRIIEPYPDDSRGQSCLILGFTKGNKPLHVVCGNLEEDDIIIITAYEPDPQEWERDWKTRKRGN